MPLAPSLTRTSPEQCGYVIHAPGNKRMECYASGTYAAQCFAAQHLNIPKKQQHRISVYLCEKANGVPYVHVATE